MIRAGVFTQNLPRVDDRFIQSCVRIIGCLWLLLAFSPHTGAGQDTASDVDVHPASIIPPGNFSGAELPQFILVTFDDGITSFAESFIQPVVEGLVNPDGSKAPISYFITKVNTDPALARQRYLDGNELANHTTTHSTNDQTSLDQWMWEQTELNRFLVNAVGVPSNEIAGFRAPSLLTNSSLWRALKRLEFTYDASLSEQLTVPRGVSESPGSLIWPYTMHDGAKSACLAQACPDTSLPGLWSIPLWDFYDSSGNSLGSMDPAVGHDSVFSAALEYLFAVRYNGNHCPLGLYLHAGQLWSPTRQAILRSFLQDRLRLPNVWMITMRGLIEWMRNPVPASELSQWFAAGKARGVGKIPKRPPPGVALVSPADGTHVRETTVTLLWDVVLSAVDYELQVAADSAFTSLEVDTVGLVKTTLTLSQSIPSGTYWWRVRARHGALRGNWSTTFSFSVGRVSSVGSISTYPGDPTLDQNFPNPFNPVTEFTVHLPKSARVTLVISDLLGREVAILVNASLPAGAFRARWDAHGVASGTYVCRLVVDGSRTIQSRKLLLVR